MAEQKQENPKKLTAREIGIVLSFGERILKAVRKAEEQERRETAKYNRMVWRSGRR